MFSSKNRLSKEKDFEKVYKNGKNSYTKNLGVKMIKNELALNRYGVIVGNKISKKATQRNQLKRRIRAILKEEDKELKAGYDVVVFCQPSLGKLSFLEIKEDLSVCLNRLRLVR